MTKATAGAGRAQWTGELAIAPGSAVYAGPAGDTSPHAHWAIQVAVGLDGPVVLEVGDVARYDGVIVGSGVPHALRGGGAALGLVFVEPLSTLGTATAALLDARRLAPLPASGTRALRQAFAAGSPVRVLDAATAVLAGTPPIVPSLESGDVVRVREVMRVVEGSLEGRVVLADVAHRVGVSSSGLASLLRRGAGMALRPYVRWCRLRVAVAAVARGASLTDAAHEAGFADGAHFTRTLRRMFGVAPSALMGPLRRGEAARRAAREGPAGNPVRDRWT